MYCMDVASTIAKLPFSISTVTLRYGEDDMSDLQSVPYQIGSSLRFKDKNTHIILENPSNFCKKYFTMALYDFLK